MDKLIDDVLGMRTAGRRMVGRDESTEPWGLSSKLVKFRTALKSIQVFNEHELAYSNIFFIFYFIF